MALSERDWLALDDMHYCEHLALMRFQLLFEMWELSPVALQHFFKTSILSSKNF